MTSTAAGPPALPFEQPSPFVLPRRFMELHEEGRISRVRTFAGDEAWLVTGYDDVKQLLNDDRLGNSHRDPEHAPRLHRSTLQRPRDNFATEHEDQARMRALLMPYFSAKRMRALSARVETLTDELLDRLAERTPPADLHAELAGPLPVMVICELLGIPYEDRDTFSAWTKDLGLMGEPERAMAAAASVGAYLGELIDAKRAAPRTEDVMSGLAHAEDRSLAGQEITEFAGVLLWAGYETTVRAIDFGTLILLRDPEEYGRLREDPARVPRAVEEILRAHQTHQAFIIRYAREAIDFGGAVIAPGEAVLFSTSAASHDARVFTEPGRFDVEREAEPHIVFGYGPHYCLGAPLARIELQAVFERLPRRFPGLRLTVKPEELPMTSGTLIDTVAELPVTW